MIYIDTSAFLRSVLNQDNSGALAQQRDWVLAEGRTVISSHLLRLEARRVQVRTGLDWDDFQQELETIEIVEVDSEDFRRAFEIPVHVKSLDALHLASCMKVGAEALFTADKNMRDVAQYLGIPVLWAG
ncbi:type II toxin-antitoxin system VapC family toxin [Nesterenkonia ebinurensis]|uniref:type II toxin-antitoxin system VapC family toxin n=1 Tax=Nesterenkonia ebinurensis TaxID=2608252 RepID=UPI00123E35BE|nr:type II toxin-antitoxin system VapC family toxin [Nesterenkonia ebinurensis]